MTDCTYVSESGVLDDFVSDHYTTFCTRKKRKEQHDIVARTVCDYRAFDEAVLENSLLQRDWSNFDQSLDPDVQWEIILNYVLDILSIMCPYKIVQTKRKPSPWLTPEIYRAIREKKNLVKLYKKDKDPQILRQLKIQRNFVNALIEKSKSNYIKSALKANTKKPKKFWKLIKDMIDNDDCVDITSYVFKHFDKDEFVSKEGTPDFLNSFFANIANVTCPRFNARPHNYDTLYDDVNTVFDFMPLN